MRPNQRATVRMVSTIRTPSSPPKSLPRNTFHLSNLAHLCNKALLKCTQATCRRYKIWSNSNRHSHIKTTFNNNNEPVVTSHNNTRIKHRGHTWGQPYVREGSLKPLIPDHIIHAFPPSFGCFCRVSVLICRWCLGVFIWVLIYFTLLR